MKKHYDISAKVTFSICLVATLFGFSFGTWNILIGNELLGIIDFIFGLLGFLSLVLVIRKPDNKLVRWITVVSSASLFYYLFITGGDSGSGILWGVVLAVCASFFLGFRIGLIVIASYLLLFIATVLWAPSWMFLYPLAITIRFVGVYVVVSLISLVYGYIRENDEAILKKEITSRRESEEKLNKMFMAMTEIVVIHEAVYDQQGRMINYLITACNEAFTRSTGILREKAQGRLATEVYGTEEPPYLKEYSEVVLTGKPLHFSTYYKLLGKFFEISAVKMMPNCFATITTDITLSKKSQQKLIALYEETSRVNEIMNGREDRVIELKKEVNTLSCELKRGIVYKSVEGIVDERE